MLVLSRREGEQIEIDGGITVTVVRMSGERVYLGIDAPKATRVDRAEVADRRSRDQAGEWRERDQ